MPGLAVYDDIDKALIEDRMALLNTTALPNTGEFVLRSDGAWRIAKVFDMDDGIYAVSLIRAGEYHLGFGWCLYTGYVFPKEHGFMLASDLELTGETRPGDVWVHHHNDCNSGKVTRVVNLRVWRQR